MAAPIVKHGSFADRRRGSRHERGYGTAWQRVREVVLRRDGGLCRCARCTASGEVRVAHEVDHVVPKHLGGTDDLDNLRAINRECHAAKTAAEALAARGVAARPSAACAADGMPTDPCHPWSRVTGGSENFDPRQQGPISTLRLQDAEMDRGGFGG